MFAPVLRCIRAGLQCVCNFEYASWFHKSCRYSFYAIYFLNIDAESLLSDVVPLGHFRRVADSQADAIIFFRNYHRSTVFGFCDIKSFSQSDVFERG